MLDAEERANENSGLANAVIPRRYLDAQDATGYQFVQCRGLFVLETAIGKVAILPMGMAQVSSVVFVKPGTQELIRLSEKEKKKPLWLLRVKAIFHGLIPQRNANAKGSIRQEKFSLKINHTIQLLKSLIF